MNRAFFSYIAHITLFGPPCRRALPPCRPLPCSAGFHTSNIAFGGGPRTQAKGSKAAGRGKKQAQKGQKSGSGSRFGSAPSSSRLSRSSRDVPRKPGRSDYSAHRPIPERSGTSENISRDRRPESAKGPRRRRDTPQDTPRFLKAREPSGDATFKFPTPPPKERRSTSASSNKGKDISTTSRERQSGPASSSASSSKPAQHIPAPPEAPSTFASFSPPLLPGLLSSIHELLGPNATPTPVQSLSLEYFFKKGRASRRTSGSSETLLAAETGSGKTLAYLMPVLQSVKETESEREVDRPKHLSPRALVLAPTHELCRQLAATVKAVTHVEKLRTLCLSNPLPKANKTNYDAAFDTSGPSQSSANDHSIDVIVGTPSAMFDMFKLGDAVEEELDAEGNVVVKKEHGSTQGLERVEWVVVDEADVLFGRDFRASTRALLHFIREARTKATLPSDLAVPDPPSLPAPGSSHLPPLPPFNLLMSTATVSHNLSGYLDDKHPRIVRLESPNLHRLPATLRTEHVSWSGGNRDADVVDKIKQTWAQDARRIKAGQVMVKSRILIFCNKTSKVEHLGDYLNTRSIPTLMLTSESELRRKGSNKHLDGFLVSPRQGDTALSPTAADHNAPRVLVTTSLLSRGLDFSPTVSNVFIVDEPKNMVDFIHRAGRSGRAGHDGNVVIFSKDKGRGNYQDEVRSRLKAVG